MTFDLRIFRRWLVVAPPIHLVLKLLEDGPVTNLAWASFVNLICILYIFTCSNFQDELEGDCRMHGHGIYLLKDLNENIARKIGNYTWPSDRNRTCALAIPVQYSAKRASEKFLADRKVNSRIYLFAGNAVWGKVNLICVWYVFLTGNN